MFNTLIGTTKSKDAQTTPLAAELPAYRYVNLFANYDVNESVTLALNVKNALNAVGYTEVSSDRAAARSIDGRTVNVTARYNF